MISSGRPKDGRRMEDGGWRTEDGTGLKSKQEVDGAGEKRESARRVKDGR